jgi:signal transduction histidine kinase
MNRQEHPRIHRILIVDDEPVIRLNIEQALTAAASQSLRFEIVGVDSGPAALKAVELAHRDGRPFSVAFVDLQLGSAWDGLETLQHLWETDGDLQAVLCTADPVAARRGLERLEARHDQLLFLEKPFGSLDVTQFARALTSRWDLQRQMREYASELERRVQERTAEMRLSQERLLETNAALIVARDQANAANRAKSAFLANMSHEIRTPMTAVLGFIDIVADADTSPADRESCIETIRTNAGHLLTLINDILDLSRVEAGELPIERRSFRPRDLVHEIVEFLRPRAEAKGLTVTTRTEAHVPTEAVTDDARLRQVLTNLIGNAIKFTERGGVEVVLRLQEAPPAPPQLQFQVIDSGIGIAPERLDEIFLPFAQADDSVTRRFGGTGLGLTISRQLARRLGGDVTAVSHLGTGSTFEVTIPVNPSEEASTPFADLSPVDQAGESTEPVRLHLLLAEDCPDLAHLYIRMLRRRGCDVVHAFDGRQAVKCALDTQHSKRPFDAVIMDMQMPVQDGYSATRELRQSGYTGPIIAYTAHAMTGDRKRCLDAGCNSYLPKPADAASLLSAIQNVMQSLADGRASTGI